MNLILSGNNYQKIALMVKFMKLGTLSKSMFHQIQGLYCVPCIETYWAGIQAEVLERLREQPLHLSGVYLWSNVFHKCMQNLMLMCVCIKYIYILLPMDELEVQVE